MRSFKSGWALKLEANSFFLKLISAFFVQKFQNVENGKNISKYFKEIAFCLQCIFNLVVASCEITKNYNLPRSTLEKDASFAVINFFPMNFVWASSWKNFICWTAEIFTADLSKIEKSLTFAQNQQKLKVQGPNLLKNIQTKFCTKEFQDWNTFEIWSQFCFLK